MAGIIKSYIKKVQTWGLRGVWNFFIGKIEARRLRHFFLANAKRYPLSPSGHGVTIVAPFHANYSLSKVMRDFVFSLHRAGISFQTFDTSKKSEIVDSEINPFLTPKKDFRILKYSNVIELFNGPVPKELGLKKSHIVFWEFESGLVEAFPELQSEDLVIAMSDFDLETFRKQLPNSTPVKKILYPFQFDVSSIPARDDVRSQYGIRKDDFVVFFNFDYGSSFFRKNPDGAMRAFAEAFRDVDNAKLVFKTNHVKEHRDKQLKLAALANDLAIADKFITIDEYISKRDVYGLTRCCDLYLSLHRGEGFGLGVAEAMAMGKAVVVTDYSSTKEFCNSDNALPISYSMINLTKADRDHPCYLSVTSCANPDIHEAARAMRKCYDDPVFCKELGAKAKDFIFSYFSTENFRKSMEQFLSHE